MNGFENQDAKVETPLVDIILEWGPGHFEDHTAFAMSDDFKKRIAKGARLVSISNKEYNLVSPNQGEVLLQSLEEHVRTDNPPLEGKVKTLFVANVFGEKDSSASRDHIRDAIFKKMNRLLSDHKDSKVIICEFWTPMEASWLLGISKDDWGKYGLEAEKALGDIACIRKMTELNFSREIKLKCSGYWGELSKHKSPISPFILVLRKKKETV